MKPGRLVLLCTNLARGGAETQVALLAREMQRRNWQVSVISLVAPTAFVADLESAGIPVWSPRMRPGKPDVLGLLRLIIHLRNLRPSVIHAHLFHANMLARCLRLMCPVPVVISTIHSLAETGRGSTRIGTRDLLYRLTDSLADRTSCVSAAVSTRHLRARAVSAQKLLTIPNGADPSSIRPDPAARARLRRDLALSDDFVWLAVGRLMWKKDYPTLLRAMALQPDCELLIAGDGPLAGELQLLAKELGARVRFLGLRDDVPALMSAADGLVLSSSVEGLPMVLIEAALCGLPCVATNVGGVSEVVRDGETGFVAPPQDADALAAAMQRLAELTAGERGRWGENARELAREAFSIETVGSRWEDVYSSCLTIAERRVTP